MRSTAPRSPRIPDRPQVAPGFSLVELVAVMIVASVLAIAALPIVSSLKGTRSKTATRQLYHDVCFARQRALATGVRSWIYFDTTAQRWSLLVETLANPGRTNAAALTDPVTGGAWVQQVGTNAYAGVQVMSAVFDGGTKIGFDWRGCPLNTSETPLAAQGTVRLTGGDGINVEVGTGYVTLVLP
jgi:prepilin-type N-terminal cleavage/methylation domain-containing protein